MLGVEINVIDKETQRYPTVGDWVVSTITKHNKDGPDEPGPFFDVRVSSMKNWKYELLVAVHEIIEVALCYDRGISDEVVTSFDVKFERERAEKLHSEDEEPGDSPDAPYFKEHQFATIIEKEFAKELGVKWEEYNDAVNSL